MEINCARSLQKNGCVLGDQCPNLKYTEAASKFIANTSLDTILENGR